MYTQIIRLFLLFFLTSCVHIKVFVPGSSKNNLSIPTTEKRYSIESQVQSKHFATIEPFLLESFYAREYQNLYGTLEELISKELDRIPDYTKKGELLIEVKEFQLSSVDFCSTNKVSVLLTIHVMQKGSTILNFHHKDFIESKSTDCYMILSNLSVIGWLWYGPYLGFRGSIEDQINQLGTISLVDFFENLKRVTMP